MSKKISGAEYSLADIFSSKFSYSIPPYQRPYAWTEEESGALFDDLLDFHNTEQEDNYFLGSIVLNIYSLVAIRRNYVILRLDSFVSDAAAMYEPSVLTIEHVLPQTVDPSSEWAVWWPDENERALWLHKIANLVPLTRRTNAAAQNYDFKRKKEEYFASKRGTTLYALTTQVRGLSTWTKSVVQQRQKELLQVFKEKWMLQ
ncbi:MAG: DUF262 domain-containing HNH endonuclease family protein [Coriobacteriales bacterium]|jgi:hypothetical protein|nr:DUF262 domain-containing HNH endonuclease family protein [Coriobacteriales bacterium]